MVVRTRLHYALLERIGAGSMGEVWRAHDARVDRTVVGREVEGNIWSLTPKGGS